eukprot:7379420-Prymnesium_polylepis.1
MAPQEVKVVRVGVLLSSIGTQASGYARGGWWPRMGWYQALREINNKSDGVADRLLPRTRIEIAYRDSKCDPPSALRATMTLIRDVFDGAGVHMILGAACSGASTRAAEIVGALKIPILSPTSSSGTLSSSQLYPTFLRVIPADPPRFEALADVLSNLFNYSSVALVSSLDEFGRDGVTYFSQAAARFSITLLVQVDFLPGATILDTAYARLLSSGAHIIVIVSKDTAAIQFMSGAFNLGIGGEGFLWFGVDWSSNIWQTVPALVEDAALRLRVLKGGFSIDPGDAVGTAAYDGYVARRQMLPPTGYDGTSCNLETDDDGGPLWAQDHDQNSSTPLMCLGYDLQHPSIFEAYAYDAMYAIAHALHYLVEQQNRTEIIGEELLDALIQRVSFAGATGSVSFQDGADHADRLGRGDRSEHGITYFVSNYVDLARALVKAGTYTSCSD